MMYLAQTDNLLNVVLTIKKMKSKCCKSDLVPVSCDEGTSYYECKKCGKGCDIE